MILLGATSYGACAALIRRA